MSNSSQISALIHLLDDEDPEVFDHVSAKLISFGKEIIPELESAWGDSFNPLLHERIENLIHQIQFEDIYVSFQTWTEQEEANLLEGALIIARFHFPDLSEQDVRLQISEIQQKIWLEIGNHLTPLETTNVFNQVFYNHFGFGGSYSAKPQMHDYCINHVLDSKKGNSISLGIIYLIIAQALKLPVYGVALHRHFIMAYTKDYIQDFLQDKLDSQVIFYINPMNKVQVFSRNEITEYLKTMKTEPQSSFYNPISNKQVIAELLNYIHFFLDKKEEYAKAGEVKRLLELI